MTVDVSVEAVRAIEAIVLVGQDPVPTSLLAELVELPATSVDAVCEQLARTYEEAGHGFTIAKVAGGWSVWQQFGVQATAVGITIAYAAVVSLVLLFIIEKTIGLRVKESDEMSGLDHSMHGEQGYGLINPN